MASIELLKQTRDVAKSLNDMVVLGGTRTHQKLGSLPHVYSAGYMASALDAAIFMDFVCGIVEDPEVGREYPLWRPIRRAGAQKATRKANEVIEAVPRDALQRFHDFGREVLQSGLLDAMIYHARAMRDRAGQPITAEDRERAIPLITLGSALNAYYVIKGSYSGPGSEQFMR